MVDKKTLTLESAEATIEAFGGVRPMATALGVPASTVQGWKERGNIPKSRHGEIRAAHAHLGENSHIPVDHAIDAAADMVDTAPFVSDQETRNYHPPRSAKISAGARGASGGSGNLVLSLILVALLGLALLLGWLVFQSRQGLNGQRLAALEANMDTLAASGAQTASQLTSLNSRLAQIAESADNLITINERYASTTRQIDDVSQQLSTLAADLETRSRTQGETLATLALAQTDLFESLSQEMVAQMDAIAANLDQSITDQMARLETRASIAQEEAQRQQDLALENEQKAREAEVKAREAEASKTAAIRDVILVTRLRLALADQAPFADALAGLEGLNRTSADIELAAGALAPYAATAYGQDGLPTLASLRGEIDGLAALDRQIIREAAGLGLATIPSTDDRSQNQGRLAAANLALSGGDLDAALRFIEALDGPAAQETIRLINILQAMQAVELAMEALDRWLNQVAQDEA